MIELGRRSPRRRRPAERFHHPGRVIAGGFAAAIVVGTALLSLPAATESGTRADLIDAFFSSTSAVCVTGLVTVDTAGYWSTFGEVVILVLIQVGGLGIMTLATLFALALSGRVGLRARLLVQAETKALRLADIRHVLRNVVIFSLGCELLTAAVLSARFASEYGEPAGRAAYDGVFHAVSAFNNAGFSLNADSLMRFTTDPWVTVTVAVAVILGGLGFPVIFELVRSGLRPRTWSALTRITITVTVALIAVGTASFAVTEGTNPSTMGPLSGPGKLLASFFAAVMPRTAGFNSVDISQMRPESLLVTDVLMFIGGGSAGVAGGIKVTTFGLLAAVVWAEIRGEARVNVGRWRIAEGVQRQALAVALLSIAVVAAGTFALLFVTPHSLDLLLFEAVSAFGTVGLSAGITADLPLAAHLVLSLLMFVGRIGPLTLTAALSLRERTRRYTLPEERPIIG